MEWVILLELIAAVLAFIGIFCLGRYVSDRYFLPREMVEAVMILDDSSRENADLLLRILQRGIWRQANRRICVIISERFGDDGELIEMIRASGAEYRIVKEN